MNKKLVAWSSAMTLLTPLLAGVMKTTTMETTLSKEDRLKMDIQYDQAVLKNPDFLGGPLRYAQLRQEEARRNLAQSQEALTALQTASRIDPATLQKNKITWLEMAIQKDKANINRPGQGTVQKTLTLQTLKKGAEKDLARHETRLAELKGPSARERVSFLIKKVQRKLT